MPFRLNPQYFNPSTYKAVRSLWFEDIPDTARVAPKSAVQRWFGVGREKHEKEAFDQTCHSNFRSALESVGPFEYPLPPPANDRATEGTLAPEIASPFIEEIKAAQAPETAASTALGMILLLDQMTRNIFRADQARIYSHYDRISRAIAYNVLDPANRLDLAYKHNFIYRAWFYLPLEHSEFNEDHERLEELMKEAEEHAAEEGGEDARAYVRTHHEFETKHWDILKRFNRYPHRNQFLGRENTKEEEDYLSSGNAQTFGTS